MGETALHILVEGFDVFGVHIQFWMPLAVLVVGVAIAGNEKSTRQRPPVCLSANSPCVSRSAPAQGSPRLLSAGQFPTSVAGEISSGRF